MIEARVDTIMRDVLHAGLSLPAEQLRQRRERVRQGGKVCKGNGCITRISAYNRDRRGHPETLCYKCRSATLRDDDLPHYSVEPAEDNEDARIRYVCAAKGHDITEVGRYSNYRCRQCARDEERARNQARAKAANRSYVSLDSRVPLVHLAELMEKHGISLNALDRETGIPAGTLRGYAKIGEAKGYRCPPERAKMIAVYFRVSVAELVGEEKGEVVEDAS